MGYIVVTDNIKRDYDSIQEINPFDNNQLELLKEYDFNKKTNYLKCLESFVTAIDNHDFELYKMTSPIVKTLYCVKAGDSLKHVCLVEYENDLKMFKVYIDKNNYQIRDKLVNYAFNNLAMEEAMFFVNKSDDKIINSFIKDDYISLSEEKEEYATFLKEKEDYSLSQNSIICV